MAAIFKFNKFPLSSQSKSSLRVDLSPRKDEETVHTNKMKGLSK